MRRIKSLTATTDWTRLMSEGPCPQGDAEDWMDVKNDFDGDSLSFLWKAQESIEEEVTEAAFTFIRSNTL